MTMDGGAFFAAAPDRDGSASLADAVRDSWDNAKPSSKAEAHRCLTGFRTWTGTAPGSPAARAAQKRALPCYLFNPFCVPACAGGSALMLSIADDEDRLRN